MGKRKRRTRRAFSDEFKAETVKLVRGSDKSIAAIARELDLTETALRAWVRQAEIDAGRLRGELDRLLRSLGITAVYVTHDQAEAMALGDRIVVMRSGAIAQIGTP